MQKDFSKLTLLYVEDDDITRINAIEYLSDMFANVLEASDGLEAYQIYEEESIDIIITDIEMPKLNGLEMAKKIRKFDKKIPIIITTAFTTNEYLLEAVELQLIKYIAKPVSPQKFNDALDLAYDYLHEGNIFSITPTTFFDQLNKTLLIENKLIKLTKNETLLLDMLVKYHQRVVTFTEIEHLIWYERSMSMDSLRSLVKNLRKKMQGDYIENLLGHGYRLSIIS